MKGKEIMKELTFINPKYICEAESDRISAAPQAKHRTGRMGIVILAACLVFALAATAYAADALGLWDLLRRSRNQIPDTAQEYIQAETEAAQSEDWSCAITESLSDAESIMATVTVRGGDKFIVVPTDCDPSTPAKAIGLSSDLSLGELARQQGKKLLFAGATITRVGQQEISHSSQLAENRSESELVILTKTSTLISSEETQAICQVYVLEEGGTSVEDVQRFELPFTLNRAPSVTMTYRPADPDAIPGITVGDMTVSESALGYSIYFPENMEDSLASNKMLRVKFPGFTCGEGSRMMHDDGQWYYKASNCQGTLGDTITVQYYGDDDQLLGSIDFQRVKE